ncbi:hypothetical protein EJ076_35000 [Mesorhizobium sp. M7D.F.Ca.US.005.01.1.1]|uniref:hypothetical protein n=1 Tax=Mesorhizobium sp. M7D.F.Ca.US.005.01.1.1 TaxID=2493678 RepID=UPI000F763A38|nr:hypothetical protein [Mesorhizobium sp. M7D.F.Ca.US.005.01.1.1]AZO39695.1 hypothetical protein EJ076_00045 [Mesorhizobium sp. M7D.F.Ca.US.005.01.1.1]AZO45925.1 hypothetical protein EJ076_35000 [Mesorhizobium sp. M7D.F.Ca.US.005.01.1.1]
MKLTERSVKDITRRVAADCARIARTCGPEIRQPDGTTVLGEADAEFIASAIEKEYHIRGRLALSSGSEKP